MAASLEILFVITNRHDVCLTAVSKMSLTTEVHLPLICHRTPLIRDRDCEAMHGDLCSAYSMEVALWLSISTLIRGAINR